MARDALRNVVRSALAVAALGSSGPAFAEATQWALPPQLDPGAEAAASERDLQVAPSERAFDASSREDPGTTTAPIEQRYETEHDRVRRYDDGESDRKDGGQ